MKDIIVLMGGPGSGKGRATEALRAVRDFNYIETGAMFRALPSDCEIAKFLARGELVPDSELFPLIESKIDFDQDTILDGFPRTIAQAEWFINTYTPNFNIRVLFIDVPEETMIQRINNRLVVDGSTRTDDADAMIIRNRLSSFQNKTMPAINWMQNSSGIEFITIDGLPPYPQVSKDILEKLNIKH